MAETLKVKVRLKNVRKGHPLELTVLPRVKVVLDENGVAEVDEKIARQLLSPDHAGAGWELVTETPADLGKGKRASKAEETPKTKEEFLQQI